MCMGAGASSSCPVNETCALGVEDFTWNRTWVTRPCGEGDPKLSDMSVVQLADFCDQYELDISMAAKMAYEISVGHNWTRVRGFWAVKGTNLLSTQRKVLEMLKHLEWDMKPEPKGPEPPLPSNPTKIRCVHG